MSLKDTMSEKRYYVYDKIQFATIHEVGAMVTDERQEIPREDVLPDAGHPDVGLCTAHLDNHHIRQGECQLSCLRYSIDRIVCQYAGSWIVVYVL